MSNLAPTQDQLRARYARWMAERSYVAAVSTYGDNWRCCYIAANDGFWADTSTQDDREYWIFRNRKTKSSLGT
jgi:hypothetical protein